MDLKKQPGIELQSINLIKCVYERVSQEIAPMQILSKFYYDYDLNKDKGDCTLALNVKGISTTNEAELFNSEIIYQGSFSVNKNTPNAQLEEFFKYYAAEFLVPYIRETLSSISIKSGLGTILLPPINIIAMLKKVKN